MKGANVKSRERSRGVRIYVRRGRPPGSGVAPNINVSRTMGGFISIQRSIMTQPWWQDLGPNDKVVMFTAAMLANHRDTEWRDAWEDRMIAIARGSFLCSKAKFAQRCGKGISAKIVDGAWHRLAQYGVLRVQKWAKKFCVVSVLDYNSYSQPAERTGPAMGLGRDLARDQRGSIAYNNADNGDKRDKKKKDASRTRGQSRSGKPSAGRTNGPPPVLPEGFTEWLPALNELFGTHWRSTSENGRKFAELYAERLGEGRTPADLRSAIKAAKVKRDRGFRNASFPGWILSKEGVEELLNEAVRPVAGNGRERGRKHVEPEGFCHSPTPWS